MTRRRILTIVTVTLIIASAATLTLWKRGWFDDDGGGHTKLEHAAELWTCSMHPFIVRDKPGTCPICGMELIRKGSGGAGGTEKGLSPAIASVAVSSTQRVMANLKTDTVKYERLVRTISAVGTIQYDQSRQAKVTSWVAGRIDQLPVDRVGMVVTKDRPLALVYSPELYSTQQEYLLALKSRERLKKSPVDVVAKSGDDLVAAARKRLELFGVKGEQIEALEREGRPNILLPIHTPLSGVVVEKLVQKGEYVSVGTPLFNIADLSRVWAEIELFEDEIPHVSLGTTVTITSAALPGRRLSGRVTYLNPFVDPKTRTVRARVELPNPAGVLRPDMFVNAAISIPLSSSLVVPLSAVVDTGSRSVVWVEREGGVFEQRTVETGERAGDRIQIRSGLTAGEKVAVSGAYLIDSESQLSGGGGSSGHAGHEGGKGSPSLPAAPPPPAKRPIPMDDMKM